MSSTPRPITIRAMIAAECCAVLSTGAKHLVHVLALRADNTTGRGLTGQDTIGLYMGITGRQVRRLWAELDAAWEAGTSPVGTLRHKRFKTSDAYTLVVRPDAALTLDRPRSRPDICAKVNRTPVSAKAGVNRTYSTSGPDTSVRLTPSYPDTSVLQTTQLTLQSEAVEKKKLPRAGASGATPHASAGEGTTEGEGLEDTAQAAFPSAPIDPFAIASARRRARKLEREQRKGQG